MVKGRSQESGEVGIIEKTGGRIVRVIFLPYSTQNVYFFGFINQKSGTFSRPEMAQTVISKCFYI
ncbi:hypothetical protein ACP6PL_23560 [Dapis sp. BLCC M126]|uniref:hypothetical protein n=1 Tax=Dapis sp. BLCC M126 TaxID=3400189 RepID=UPI003CF766F6